MAKVTVAIANWLGQNVQATTVEIPVTDRDETVTDSLQDTDRIPSRAMTIRVLGPDGKPMKGVKIFRNHVYKTEVDGEPKIENKDYFTDADGRTMIALSGISVDLRLWARKKEFIPLHAMWAKKFQADGDRIPPEFTFQLEHGTEIGGIVKNEQGEPIKGVKVEVQDRTAIVFNVIRPKEPGRRPVRSHWLTRGQVVLTDAKGRWKIENVPPDESLVFQGLYEDDPGPKIALRLSHPDYAVDKEWGRIQRDQGVTHNSLRDQTATIVMRPRNSDRTDR